MDSKKLLTRVWVVGTGTLLPTWAWAQAKFDNPLDANDLTGVITNIINYLLGLVFVLALLALVVGGIRMVGSFGNEQAVASAKKIIMWALIGLAVTLLAWSIIGIVIGFLGAN